MIPEILVIRDENGEEVATLTNKGGKFTIEVVDGYEVETVE